MLALTAFAVVALTTVLAYTFENIAADPSSSGLHYRRKASRVNTPWVETLRSSLEQPIPVSIDTLASFPFGSHGQPGVAVGDFNGGKFSFRNLEQFFM